MEKVSGGKQIINLIFGGGIIVWLGGGGGKSSSKWFDLLVS